MYNSGVIYTVCIVQLVKIIVNWKVAKFTASEKHFALQKSENEYLHLSFIVAISSSM